MEHLIRFVIELIEINESRRQKVAETNDLQRFGELSRIDFVSIMSIAVRDSK